MIYNDLLLGRTIISVGFVLVPHYAIPGLPSPPFSDAFSPHVSLQGSIPSSSEFPKVSLLCVISKGEYLLTLVAYHNEQSGDNSKYSLSFLFLLVNFLIIDFRVPLNVFANPSVCEW